MGELIDFVKIKKERAEKEIDELRERLRIAVERLGEPEVGPYYVEVDDRADLVNRVIEFVISQRGVDGYSGWVIDSTDL
jgi:hypothetical protein